MFYLDLCRSLDRSLFVLPPVGALSVAPSLFLSFSLSLSLSRSLYLSLSLSVSLPILHCSQLALFSLPLSLSLSYLCPYQHTFEQHPFTARRACSTFLLKDLLGLRALLRGRGLRKKNNWSVRLLMVMQTRRVASSVWSPRSCEAPGHVALCCLGAASSSCSSLLESTL